MPAELVLPDTVTTWSRLVDGGLTPARIRAQLAAARWRRWGYAIVLHNGPLTRLERWYVASAHGGPGALLTGFTAAEAYGLRGWERTNVDVLARRSTHGSPRSPVPLHVHRVSEWSTVRRHAHCAVQVLPQALCIAASTFEAPRPACGLLAAAVQQRLTSAARLAEAIESRSRLRHRRILLATVHDIAQGAEALSEIDFVRLCRRFALPEPLQQAVRRQRDGRRRYLDAAWRRGDGRLVVVEVDGALHLDPRRWWDDQERQNELVLAEAIVLRFPSVVVRTRPDVVAAQLRRALRV